MEYLQFALVFAFGFAGFYLGTLFAKSKCIVDPRVLGVIRRMSEVELELADLRELHERVLASHKKLSARVGMDRARRAKRESEEEPSDFEIANRFTPGRLFEPKG